MIFLSGDISYTKVVDSVVDILRKAQTSLPQDVVVALKNARAQESSQLAREQLDAILRNIEIASEKQIPICQDTGILIFFVDIGRDLKLDFDIGAAIAKGVEIATECIPLRPNAVDPLTRHNPGTNIGEGIPDIKYELVEGRQLKITVAPKGAGSENMSVIKMLNPTEVDRIPELIIETVLNAGGRPCPPVILGVGIGGSFDKAARLAKLALLEPTDNMDGFERGILHDINTLGIGPMGLGGDTTALALHIKKAYCHTASLPVAINIQCWANRHASVTLGDK